MYTKRTILNSVLGVGIAAVAVTGWATIGRAASVASATTSVVTAQTGNVLSSVTGTGNVIVPTQVAVGFDSAVSSAKITQVLAAVGDKVTVGQPLAKVDDTLTAQALAAAQAQVASAQAALDKAQNAVTPAIVAQDKATADQSSLAVSSARAAVTNARNTLATDQTLQSTAADQAQQSLDDAQAKANQDLANQQAAVTQAQTQLDADNTSLASAQSALAASPGDAAAQSAVNTAETAVAKDTTALQSATNSQASMVLSTNQAVEQATNNLTNAQNNAAAKLAADQVAIDNAVRQVASANASYQSTLASNAVKEQPPTADDLAGAQAGLVNAQNALATAQRNESNTTLVAPEAGTITATTATVGAAASGSGASSSSATSSSSSSSGSSGLFTLDDLGSLQIKVGFSESDAANVQVGQAASVTFASLTGVTATGKVSQLDLTATTVSNVVTYYAYITLDQSQQLDAVKPGMTASVQVVVAHADGVVFIPTSAVTTRGTTATVNVEVGNDPKSTTPTQITIGLRGDSAIEVTSGLKAGDKVVVVRQSAAGTSTGIAVPGAGGGGGGLGGGGFTPGAGRVGG